MPFLVADKFSFSCAPKMGSQYILKAFVQGEIPCERHASTKIHQPGRVGDLPAVTVQRPPHEWLRSLFQNLHTLSPTGHHPVDQFFGLSRQSFTHFIQDYLNRIPGAVSAMFESYPGDHVILIDECPASLIEVLKELGVPHKWALYDIGPQNSTPDKIVMPDDLRQRVIDAEPWYGEHAV